MSLYKISKRGLLASSLYELPINGYKWSLGKICVRDLLANSQYKISVKVSRQDLYTSSLKEVVRRSLYKLSQQDLGKRPLGKICWEGCASDLKNSHRATTRGIRHARSAEKVVQAISKIRTAPQREGSDTHEVLRRLRERSQNSHRATTRGIRHARSAEKVARAISKIRTAPQREGSDTEKVARAISKFAPRHNDRDPRRTKCWEGCASDLKIRTAPQREGSDTHKVTRGFRQRSPRHPVCASLRSRNAHGHLTRDPLRCNSHQKRRAHAAMNTRP